MRKNQIISLVLLSISGLLMFAVYQKSKALNESKPSFAADQTYRVSFNYYLEDFASEDQVNWYLPQNSSRQQIDSLTFPTELIPREDIYGTRLRWTADGDTQYKQLQTSFVFKGKAYQHQIPENFKRDTESATQYLVSTPLIQADAPEIIALADQIRNAHSSDLLRITAAFDRVMQIPSAPIITKTDALTALSRNYASCNGKSRLFVALARAMGYPARLSGGLILENTQKRTSHVWTELKIDGHWIPFDTLNGHFGYLPANYLAIHHGDRAMLSHSPGMSFDYNYQMEQLEVLKFLERPTATLSSFSPLGLFRFLESGILNTSALYLILMLPLGGLLVAFLRNVVGLKTFGVFLPVLIAYALFETGFGLGILLFTGLILFVGLASRPFQRLGLLHTPKLVISLTLMVVFMLAGTAAGLYFDIPWLSSLTVFPTIILTLSAEKFSNLIVEDGLGDATRMLFQTLLAVSCCYLLFQQQVIFEWLVVFPEFLLLIIVIAILLGRYIGFRLVEIVRFNPLLK
ncbi:7TM domain-containing protein [Gilvibacter sp.]|uniref:7TM domain-containing protein n=1 Tax=Gilvibacter sp. TaxID=2729997 RepID=UPI003F4A12F0